jgi:hypothetical protein
MVRGAVSINSVGSRFKRISKAESANYRSAAYDLYDLRRDSGSLEILVLD